MEETLPLLPSPDLIVPFTPRSLVALSGVVTVVAGVWHVDRTWDEVGSHAYERAKTKLLGNKSAKVEISTQDLDKAFPFPWAFILGWFLYAVANLMPADAGESISLSSIDARAATAAAVSMALGWIASVPMGEAVRFRDAAKKQKMSLMFLASWLLLTAVGGPEGVVATSLRGVGAAMIIASMKILWKFRKMGDTWEQQGQPNPNPVVYNAGGPLFVLGWFFFWVGMASVAGSQGAIGGIPIYFTNRSILAFCAGCGMVPVVLFLDYAHDEGAEFTGFGTDGRFFGRFLESPIPFVAAWTLFGASSLLPFTDLASVTTLQWIILANCVLQGIDAGVLIQSALYKGDMAGKQRWSVPFVLLFMALAIEIGKGAGGLGWAAIPGAMLIILGQVTVFGDRKRGDYWMANNQIENPNPIVYSAGEPIFMLGWILMWLTMSLPTH